jgi:hypothetical protein
MLEPVWMVVLAIIVAAAALWLWSARQAGRTPHPDDKNPIDIES